MFFCRVDYVRGPLGPKSFTHHFPYDWVSPPISRRSLLWTFLSEGPRVSKTENSKRAAGHPPPGHVAQNLRSRRFVKGTGWVRFKKTIAPLHSSNWKNGRWKVGRNHFFLHKILEFCKNRWCFDSVLPKFARSHGNSGLFFANLTMLLIDFPSSESPLFAIQCQVAAMAVLGVGWGKEASRRYLHSFV